MATQLMKDWIVELHNPERNQCEGFLGRLENGAKSNCCLGVLEEVNGLEPVEVDGGSLSYDGRTAMPSIDVIVAVRGDDVDTILNESGDPSVKLGEDDYGDPIWAESANDDLGWSFTEIADKLEELYLNEDEAFEVRKRVEDLGWV